MARPSHGDLARSGAALQLADRRRAASWRRSRCSRFRFSAASRRRGRARPGIRTIKPSSGVMPNLETLRKSAGEYPDSPMQEFADITWADGQMWTGFAVLHPKSHRRRRSGQPCRSARTRALLSETEDARIKSRAHFGLARVYELQNELDKAREEYGKVEGGFKLIADQRIEQLDKPETKEVYAWLATAKARGARRPTGPGTPGRQPRVRPGRHRSAGRQRRLGHRRSGTERARSTTCSKASAKRPPTRSRIPSTTILSATSWRETGHGRIASGRRREGHRRKLRTTRLRRNSSLACIPDL